MYDLFITKKRKPILLNVSVLNVRVVYSCSAKHKNTLFIIYFSLFTIHCFFIGCCISQLCGQSQLDYKHCIKVNIKIR